MSCKIRLPGSVPPAGSDAAPLAPEPAPRSRDLRTGGSWTAWQHLKNGVILLIVRAGLWMADRMSPDALLRAGHHLGQVAYLLLAHERARALENLQRVLPGSDTRLAPRCFEAAGENLARSLLLRRSGLPASAQVGIDAASREALHQALGEGRGVVVVSAHLGPFELVAALVAELGQQPAVVVRESYDPRLDPLIDAHRERRGVEVIHRGRPGAAFRILRALREGRPVGFLGDLGGRMRCRPARLLGHAIDVPVGPQRIACRVGCPILVGTLHRSSPSGGFQLGSRRALRRGPVEPPFRLSFTRLPATRDEAMMTDHVANRISCAILQDPADWLWMAPRFAGLPNRGRRR